MNPDMKNPMNIPAVSARIMSMRDNNSVKFISTTLSYIANQLVFAVQCI